MLSLLVGMKCSLRPPLQGCDGLPPATFTFFSPSSSAAQLVAATQKLDRIQMVFKSLADKGENWSTRLAYLKLDVEDVGSLERYGIVLDSKALQTLSLLEALWCR